MTLISSPQDFAIGRAVYRRGFWEERDTVKVRGAAGWGGTGKGEAKTRFRRQTRGGVHF